MSLDLRYMRTGYSYWLVWCRNQWTQNCREKENSWKPAQGVLSTLEALMPECCQQNTIIIGKRNVFYSQTQALETAVKICCVYQNPLTCLICDRYMYIFISTCQQLVTSHMHVPWAYSHTPHESVCTSKFLFKGRLKEICYSRTKNNFVMASKSTKRKSTSLKLRIIPQVRTRQISKEYITPYQTCQCLWSPSSCQGPNQKKAVADQMLYITTQHWMNFKVYFILTVMTCSF